jgi:pilus assembly protein CpaB
MARQQTGGRFKATLFMGGAVVFAALTAFLMYEVINRAEKRAVIAGKIEKQTVVIATRDLYMGIPVSEDDIELKEILPDPVQAEFGYQALDEVLRKTPRERIYKGEVIRFERLADEADGMGLNAIIEHGKRAMTIQTDAQSSLSGMLAPGNHVDVIVTIRPDDRSMGASWVTETILEDVKVLAVGDSLLARKESNDGKKASRRNRQKPSVTLQVTPSEAEKLALASSKGDLHLVLRSDIDDLVSDDDGTVLSTNALLGVGKPAAAPRARGVRKPTGTQAEVIMGTSTTTVGFDASGQKVEGAEGSRRRR